VKNYEKKEKIVKVEDIRSMRFHNMLLDLVQYNNIETPTKTEKSTSILKEYIQPCTFLVQTLKAYMDTLKFTLRKTLESLSVFCKKFHFQENFFQFGEIRIIKKEENRPWLVAFKTSSQYVVLY